MVVEVKSADVVLDALDALDEIDERVETTSPVAEQIESLPVHPELGALPQLGALEVAVVDWAAAELALASVVTALTPVPIVFGAEAFYQSRTGLDHSNGVTILLEGGPVLLRRLVYGYPKHGDEFEVKAIADLFVVDLENTEAQYWLDVDFSLVEVYAEVDIPRGVSRKLTKRTTVWTHAVKFADLIDIELV